MLTVGRGHRSGVLPERGEERVVSGRRGKLSESTATTGVLLLRLAKVIVLPTGLVGQTVRGWHEAVIDGIVVMVAGQHVQARVGLIAGHGRRQVVRYR